MTQRELKRLEKIFWEVHKVTRKTLGVSVEVDKTEKVDGGYTFRMLVETPNYGRATVEGCFISTELAEENEETTVEILSSMVMREVEEHIRKVKQCKMNICGVN